MTSDVRAALPVHASGMRIGLFGGSFNPPHAAHRAVSLFAMKRLRLDRVWWLVSPGNPLKDISALAPLEQRMTAAAALAHHPRLDVTDVEAVIGTQYTYDTIRKLLKMCPGTRFVWIMGADNLSNFHRWKKWREIADLVPIAVVDRGGSSAGSLGRRPWQTLASARVNECDAATLPLRKPPAWTFLHGLRLDVSSTALRAGRNT